VNDRAAIAASRDVAADLYRQRLEK